MRDKAIKACILENSMQPIYNIIAMFGVILVIYYGGMKVIDGYWTVGKFSAFLIIFTAMAIKASKAAKLFNSVQKSQVSWKRIKPYFSEYYSKDKTVDIEQKGTKFVIQNLSFNYPNCRENIIENISFSCEDGQIIGITGPIASGKTTLGISLLGQYNYEGSIKIDGKELKNYSDYERSQMISYLGHRPQLLSDTIYNNITLGDESDITQVLNDVRLIDDLSIMPDGINTIVGNSGVRLSGGQQSRVSLARTLQNKSKIIILQGPFSAVDMKTEEEIIQNLKRNYKGSIIIIISHRLNIFDKIDNIILIHDDKKVQYCTHKQLMESSKLYSTIYNLQGTGGLKDEK